MEKRRELADPDDLRVALEVAEDLLAEWVGDLGVDPSVLDVTVPEVVSDIFDSATGVEQMDGDRVPQRVNRAALDASGLRVACEEVLDLALLQRSLAPGEEVGSGVAPHPEVGAEELRGVTPEWLLAAEAILQPAEPDPVILEIEVLEREGGRFVHPEPVVIGQSKEGPVARGGNNRKEAVELVLVEVLGESVH